MPIQLGNDTFLDGCDPVDEFYRRLQAGTVPTTSAPPPGSFLTCYRDLAASGATAVVSIHVAGTKSAVLQSARIAADMLPNVPVHLVDSGNTSLGLGLLVRAAARWAQQGLDGETVATRARAAAARTQVLAALPGLTFLRRSGRVGLAQSLVAGLLDIKPVLRIHQGAVDVVDRVRSWPRALDRVVERARAALQQGPAEVAVVHTGAPAAGAALAARLATLLPPAPEPLCIAEAGPALASHAGPGALGICVLGGP